MNLPDDWHACERGNTMLATGEGNFVAWLDMDDEGHRLEVSYAPDNYPALNVAVVNLSDEELADHINEKLQGWIVQKCNIEGVKRTPNDTVVNDG